MFFYLSWSSSPYSPGKALTTQRPARCERAEGSPARRRRPRGWPTVGTAKRRRRRTKKPRPPPPLRPLRPPPRRLPPRPSSRTPEWAAAIGRRLPPRRRARTAPGSSSGWRPPASGRRTRRRGPHPRLGRSPGRSCTGAVVDAAGARPPLSAGGGGPPPSWSDLWSCLFLTAQGLFSLGRSSHGEIRPFSRCEKGTRGGERIGNYPVVYSHALWDFFREFSPLFFLNHDVKICDSWLGEEGRVVGHRPSFLSLSSFHSITLC